MEKIQGLSIGLDLDSVAVENGLKSLKGKLSLVDSEMRANLSSFDRSEKSMKKYEVQLTGLNKKLDVQKAAVKAAKDEYDEMVKRHGASSREAEKAAEIYNKQQATFNNLERRVGSLNDEMKEFENQQKINGSAWTKVGERLDKTSKKLNAIGQGMKNVGRGMSMYVTAPITAFGAASFKAAVDFESAFAGVRKTVDTSEAGFARLSDGIRDMAKELPIAATDIAAVAESAGQLGIAEDSILGFTRTIIDLGESTNLTREQAASEFARFANIVQMPQENFDKLGSSVVSLGNNLATTESEILSMGMRLAGTGAQIGLTESEIMALAASMSSVGIEAEAGGSAMSTVLKKIQNAVSDGEKELEGFAAAAGISTSEFAKLFEEKPIEALDAFIRGLSKSSENGENLNGILDNLGIKGIREADTVLRLAGASELLGDAVGIAGEAWEKNTALSDEAAQRYETMSSKLTILKNRFTDVAIETGNVLAPKFMALADKVEEIIDWYDGLSDSSKNTVLAMGGLAAAMGPLLVLGGNLIAGVSGILASVVLLTPAIAGAGGLTAALGTAGGAIAAFATGPIGLGILAIGGLTLAGIAFAKHMSEDAIPEVDRFGDQVSETTKEALGAFFELSDGVELALSEMKLTGARVTDEMAEEMVGKYAAMNDQILEGMKTRHEEQLTTMQDFFANSSALTNEEEQKILEKELARNEKSLETQQYYADKVKEIYETAAAEKRETTERENEIIDTINQRMQDNAISYLTESEVEQQIIMQRIKDSAGELSAQQAAEVVQRATEQKDGTIAAAEEEYENRLAEIIRLRDESGTISDEQATKLIADAKKTRDESVSYAESMHADVVEQAKLQAGEHVDLINWSTGEILSKWDVFKNDFVTFSEDFSKASIEAFGRMATGIVSKMTDGSKNVLGIVASMVNGVIQGLNWVLKNLDMKTIALWTLSKIGDNRKPSTTTTTTTAVKAYAHGTEGHPGGWALVGDGTGDNAGPEYIRTPDGKHGFSPATNTLLDLPKGTKVLSAKKTRELFGPIPRYAFGIGDIASHVWDAGKDIWDAGKKKVFDIFDYFTDPKKLLDIGLSAAGFSVPSAGGFMKEVLSGSMSTIKKGAVDFIKKALTDFGGSGGLGFGSAFRKTSSYGYRIHPILGVPQLHAGDDYGAPVGTPIPAQAGGRVTVSGFHPIRGNYVRIKSGILDRIYQHNARNLVNAGDMVKQGQYIGTVGSTGRSTGPHLHYEVLRNGVNINPKGLATGGITNGFMVSSLHEEGYPEFVIPTAPNRRTDAMKLLALAYKKIGGGDRATRPDQLPNANISAERESRLERMLEKHLELMQALIASNQQLRVAMVTPDYQTLAEGVADPVDEILGTKARIKELFGGTRGY